MAVTLPADAVGEVRLTLQIPRADGTAENAQGYAYLRPFLPLGTRYRASNVEVQIAARTRVNFDSQGRIRDPLVSDAWPKVLASDAPGATISGLQWVLEFHLSNVEQQPRDVMFTVPAKGFANVGLIVDPTPSPQYLPIVTEQTKIDALAAAANAAASAAAAKAHLEFITAPSRDQVAAYVGDGGSADVALQRRYERAGRGLIGNALAFFGDSITDYGEGYARYAEAFSSGLITPIIASNPGDTSTVLLPKLAPQITDRTPRPTACLVLCGANDAQAQTPLSTYKANVTAMVQALRAAGIVPILGTVTPNANATYDGFVRLYNTWLMRYAELERIPLVDFYTKLKNVAAAGWLPATPDSGDGLHPSTAANKVMGQLVVSSLAGLMIPRQYLVQPFAGSPNLLANSTFIVDSNSDGIPDGFSAAPASGFAYAGVADPRGFYWLRMTLSGNGTVQRRFQASVPSGSYKPGDRLRFSARVRTGQDQTAGASTPQAPVGAQVQITCYKAGYAGVTLNVPLLGLGLSRVLNDAVVSREFVIPAATEIVIVELIGGPVNGTYDFALPTVFNLSAIDAL